MKGIYIKDGQDIVAGTKTAIATPTERNIVGDRCLVVKRDDGDADVVGVAVIGKPVKISSKAFDEKLSEHGVTSSQRRQWWPDAEELFVYPIEEFKKFETGKSWIIDLPAGINMEIDVALPPTILSKKALPDGGFLYEYGYEQEGVENGTS